MNKKKKKKNKTSSDMGSVPDRKRGATVNLKAGEGRCCLDTVVP